MYSLNLRLAPGGMMSQGTLTRDAVQNVENQDRDGVAERVRGPKEDGASLDNIEGSIT